jgi:large subunit ribosomal protein L13
LLYQLSYAGAKNKSEEKLNNMVSPTRRYYQQRLSKVKSARSILPKD